MAAAMVTLIKTFTYRGNPLEEWSNSYHLTGAPTTRADWVDLVGALITHEKPCYSGACTITGALVYEDSDNPATYSFVIADEIGTEVGTLAGTGGEVFAGDQAGTLGIDTGLTGSTGKKIWLRKYFHSMFEATATPDNLTALSAAALTTFGTYLLGTAISGTIYYADKNSRRPTGSARVDPYTTTRTLKRRGKRPTS